MRSLRAFRTVCSSWATTWPTTRRAWTTSRTSIPCARECPLWPVGFLRGWGWAGQKPEIQACARPHIPALGLPPSGPGRVRTAQGDAIARRARRRILRLGAQSQHAPPARGLPRRHGGAGTQGPGTARAASRSSLCREAASFPGSFCVMRGLPRARRGLGLGLRSVLGNPQSA